MGDEEAVQDREAHLATPQELEATEQVFARGVATSGILRRPIVRRSLLMASGALGLIGVVPILNLGPLPGRKPKAFEETSWRFTSLVTDGDGKKIQGVRMIDQTGRAIKLGDIAAGGLLTVFPGIASEELKGSRASIRSRRCRSRVIRPCCSFVCDQMSSRARNKDGTYFDGHIAYSKICTHVGCPVSLYEQQTHHLLCPCHQSTFDVSDHGRRDLRARRHGPAAAAITRRQRRATSSRKGDFNEPVGPSFWERG